MVTFCRVLRENGILTNQDAEVWKCCFGQIAETVQTVTQELTASQVSTVAFF